MDGITVAEMGLDDLRDVAAMIREMDVFYGDAVRYSLDEAVARAREHFLEAGTCRALVARDGAAALGIATFVTPWPTVDLRPSIFLKDLFVREAARRRGVATALLAHLAVMAEESGYSRVDWTTDRSNPGARAAYEALGVPTLAGKVFFRLEGEDLVRVARLASLE